MRPGVRRMFGISWLISHLFVIALLVTTVNLGFWQLRRLDERKSVNAQIMERSTKNPIILNASGKELNYLDKKYRPAITNGQFQSAQEVYLINRSKDGIPGVQVITAFKLEEEANFFLVVNRGYLPLSVFRNENPEKWAATSKSIELDGVLMTPASNGLLSKNEINKIDLNLLSEEWERDLLPVVFQQTKNSFSEWPEPLLIADLGEGSHLGYALQWFIFTLIGLFGYPLVIRRIVAQD